MSQETAEWLNTQVLIGYTERRGYAWHYRADENQGEPNHYPTEIPVEDVTRRLFHWQPAEGSVETTYATEEGVTRHTDESRKTIVRPAGTFGPDDQGDILGVFKQGYQVHGYQQWLLDNVEALLGTGLHIGSAGMLKGGAVAWVQVEMADTFTTHGVEHRPYLTAATSLDGSLATTYQVGSQVVVCDNTLSAALGEGSALVAKVYHSRYSHMKIDEVRDALSIVDEVREQVDEEIRQLVETPVSDQQWNQFLEKSVFGGQRPEKGRALTTGQNKIDQLNSMWAADERVSPWQGTAFGVLQAMSVFQHHESQIKGSDRVGRNQLRALSGEWDKFDNQVVKTLETVLA